MSSKLPDRIDPVRLAERGVRLSGRLPLERMVRLGTGLANCDGEVIVELSFNIEAQGRVVLTGSVKGHVYQICQRCLEPMGLTVDKGVNLIVVRSEREAEALTGEADPLFYDGEPLSLLALVEDEVLLALPQEAKHTTGDCANRSSWHSGDSRRSANTDKDANPFAILERLKRRS